MLERAQASPDRDTDRFEERALWLGTTFGGAGRLHAELTTIVTGQIDWQVLDQLTTVWLTLHSHEDGQAPGDSHASSDGDGQAPGDRQAPGDGPSGATGRGPLPPETRARLQATILQACIDVVSGPGGLASYLRGALLNAPYTSLSQPLDIGRSTRTVPPHLYKAVILRDRHCQFPGCTQPPALCEVTT